MAQEHLEFHPDSSICTVSLITATEGVWAVGAGIFFAGSNIERIEFPSPDRDIVLVAARVRFPPGFEHDGARVWEIALTATLIRRDDAVFFQPGALKCNR